MCFMIFYDTYKPMISLDMEPASSYPPRSSKKGLGLGSHLESHGFTNNTCGFNGICFKGWLLAMKKTMSCTCLMPHLWWIIINIRKNDGLTWFNYQSVIVKSVGLSSGIHGFGLEDFTSTPSWPPGVTALEK